MTPVSRPVPRLLVATALVVATACVAVPRLVLPPPASGAPTAPGPSPRSRTFDPAALNARCEGCHQEIAAEWQASSHREAYTDVTYQRQLAHEPAAFCNSCHAPEAAATGPVPEPLGRLGVGCVTCHVVGDEVLAAPAGEPTDRRATHDGESHPLTRTADFTKDTACASCHEFPFPDSRPRGAPLLMQSTITEHAASAYADHSCASCHMPRKPGGEGGSHRDHTFSASRDEALLRSAILVEERPLEGDTLTLVLRPGRVGHAFPTGDMLRRLAFTLEVVDAEGTVVQKETRYLARHFGLSRAPDMPSRRRLLRDDRVGAGTGPVVLRHTLRRPPAGGTIHYVLRYERVSDPRGGPENRPELEGSVVLAEKTLPLSGSMALDDVERR